MNYPYLQVLLYFMAFDILLGVLRAIADKALNSDICGKGMRKKAAMLILVLAAYTFERIIGDTPVGEGLSAAFAFSEAISVIENAVLLGAPVPPWFKEVFLDLQEFANKGFRLGDSPRDYKRIVEKRSQDDPVEETLNKAEQ